MRRMITNISLATRLSLVALLVTLLSLAVTATVGLVRGSDLAEDVVNSRLTTLSSSRAELVELYVASLERQVAAMASSTATADAIRQLGDAAAELSEVPPTTAETDRLAQYYLSTVVPDLEQVRGATEAGAAAFLVPDTPAGIALQNAYTIPITSEDGTTIQPELVTNPGDGSAYSELHPLVHETFGQVAISSGFDDLILIDARNDFIAYTMRKRIDFGTSLDLGPHSGSTLARAVDYISVAPEDGVRVSGFSRYVPATEQPTMFITSPVLDGSELVGYVAAALTVDNFDDILSGDGSWSAFGDSGEAYLVGPDARMVSTSRWYSESPSSFLADASEPGPAELSEAQRRRIAATGTTATVQPVDRELIVAADDGPQIVSAVSYRGKDVRTAYERLDVPNVDWTIVVDAEADELDESLNDYASDMLFAVALFVVIVTFVVVRWSNRLVAPIRAIATRLRSTQSAETVDEAAAATTDGGPDEYTALSRNVDEMLRSLEERGKEVEERSRERRALLEQFLPAAIARRSEEVGGEVLDHVRHASVVVTDIDGIGDLVGHVPDLELRNLLGEIIDEVDALAADLGVERVKLIGSRYYAVCGVSRPLLDHAPRSVTFGLRVQDLVAELSDNRIDVRVGITEGPVSVGLAESSALVYDVWGETVTAAEGLVQDAPAGTVIVSEAVRSHLPSDFVTAGSEGTGAVAVTTQLGTEGAAP